MTPSATNAAPQVLNNAAAGVPELLFTATPTELYELLMLAPVGIVILNGPDYLIELANDMYVTISGKSRQQLLNKPAFEALPETADQGYTALLETIRKTGQGLKLYEHKTILERHGQLETVFLNIAYQPIPEPNGMVHRIMISVQEVTDQVQTRINLESSEALLRKTKEQFDLSINAGSIGIYHWDVLENKLTWSREQEALYGLAPGSFSGTVAEFYSYVHPQDLEPLLTSSKAMLKVTGDTEYQFRIIRKDGSLRWIEGRSRIAYNGEGQLSYISGINFDITEQKEQQQKLEQIALQLKSLANAMPQIVWIAEPNGEVVYYNDRVTAFAGVKKLPDGNWSWEGMLHPDDLHSTVEAWTKAVADGHVYEKEHRLEMKDGSYRWHLSRALPQKDENNTIIKWYGTATDVHDTKLAEEAIAYEKKLLETVTENTSLSLFMLDNRQRCIYMNEAAERMTGYTLAELKEQPLHNFIHHTRPDGQPFPIEACAIDHALAKHSRTQGEETFVHKDGSFYPVAFTASPIVIKGTGIGTVLEVRNTSEEKRKAQALKESEERFRTLAETLPQLVWMTDANGNYEYASRQWMAYSGLDPGDKSTWAKMVHPDDLQSLMEIWNTSLQTGNTYRVEARLRNKKGQYYWHVVQGEPMRDEDGQVKKWIGAFTNIHGQKTMNQQLEQLVTQRTQELQRSNEDLQQFAHVASHDLKEPVRKIRTFNNRLKVEFSSQLPERACFYIDKVEAAATRMHAMIDGVLEYSTVSTTEHLLEMVNLRETIRQIELDLELVIQQKGAHIFCDALPVVEGFSVLLYQLLYNLMNNALKFTRDGVAPLLHINAKLFSGADAAQEWQLNPAVEYVQVTLQDNGIGFSQIQAEKIFKTFTRLNAKEKYEGTGLGLALCKKIVERHHGVISAAGMEGMGAIFKVVLPMRQPKSDV